MAKSAIKSAENARAASRAARQQRRRDRSREDILVAARKVLLDSGVGAMTLEAVAKEAGMSKTGLYYYFPSKDALVFELVFATLERQTRAIHDAVEATRDGGDALRAIITETVKYFAPRLDDFRLAFLSARSPPAKSRGTRSSSRGSARSTTSASSAPRRAFAPTGRGERAGRWSSRASSPSSPSSRRSACSRSRAWSRRSMTRSSIPTSSSSKASPGCSKLRRRPDHPPSG